MAANDKNAMKMTIQLELAEEQFKRIFQQTLTEAHQQAAQNPIVLNVVMGDPSGRMGGAGMASGPTGVHTTTAAGRKGTAVPPPESISAMPEPTLDMAAAAMVEQTFGMRHEGGRRFRNLATGGYAPAAQTQQMMQNARELILSGGAGDLGPMRGQQAFQTISGAGEYHPIGASTAMDTLLNSVIGMTQDYADLGLAERRRTQDAARAAKSSRQAAVEVGRTSGADFIVGSGGDVVETTARRERNRAEAQEEERIAREADRRETAHRRAEDLWGRRQAAQDFRFANRLDEVESRSRARAFAAMDQRDTDLTDAVGSRNRALGNFGAAIRGLPLSNVLDSLGMIGPEIGPLQPGQYRPSDPGIRGLQAREALQAFKQSPLGHYTLSAVQNVGSVLAMQGGAYFQELTQERLTGRRDVLALSGVQGGTAFGVGGALVGSIAGPMGGFIGAYAGQQLGTMLGEFLVANQVADIRRATTLMPLGATLANWAGDFGLQTARQNVIPDPSQLLGPVGTVSGYRPRDVVRLPGFLGAKRLSKRASAVAPAIGMRFFTDPDDTDEDSYKSFYATPEQIAGAYGDVATAMLLAGEDPDAMVEGIEEYTEVIGKRSVPDIDPTTGKQRTRRVRTGRLRPRAGYEAEYARLRGRAVDQWEEGAGIRTEEDHAYARDRRKFLRGRGDLKQTDSLMNDILALSLLEPEYTDELVFKDIPVTEVRTRATRAAAFQYQTEQIARRYGTSIEQMKQVYAQVHGAKSMTGGNWADILLQFGPLQTSAYAEMITPIGGTPQVTSRQTLAAFTNLNALSRQGQIAATHATGSAAELFAVAEGRMAELAALPGGSSSVAYAEANASRRGYLLSALSEQQITRFTIPQVQRQGALQRAEMMPFGMGQRLSLEVDSIRANQREIETLKSEMETLRAGNNLSPQTELQYTQQIEGMRSDIFRSGANLSRGMENLLPAMTTGRMAGQGRFNSVNFAAMRAFALSSPGLAFGAANGRQLAFQNEFISSFNDIGTPFSSSGKSGTAGMNSVIALLERIARSLERGGGGARPQEVRGGLTGSSNRQGVDPNGLYNRGN